MTSSEITVERKQLRRWLHRVLELNELQRSLFLIRAERDPQQGHYINERDQDVSEYLLTEDTEVRKVLAKL